MVENICVYGDSYKKRTVAIVVPSRTHVEAMANKMGLTESYEQLCSNDDVSQAVLKQISASGSQSGENEASRALSPTSSITSFFPRSRELRAARCGHPDPRAVDPGERPDHRGIQAEEESRPEPLPGRHQQDVRDGCRLLVHFSQLFLSQTVVASGPLCSTRSVFHSGFASYSSYYSC